MAKITIRPLHADDKAQWTALWTAYLAFYNTTLPPDIYDSSFARMLGDDPRDFSALVAEKDGALIGLTHFVFHRHGWKIEVCAARDTLVNQHGVNSL